MSDLPKPDRTKFIGGSDIAAILNISPWRSAVQLWQDKIQPRAEEDGKGRKVKSRGKRWEATVAEMLVEELVRNGHTVEIVSSNARYVDATFPMFACEIDFEVRLDGSKDITNVELKTVHPFKANEWGESHTDSVPIWYLAQAQWGLGVTGRKNCIVAPLFGADEIRVFPVARDEETITGLRLRAAKFWSEHVLTKTPPPAVRSEDADVLFPKDSEAEPLPADDVLTAKLLRLRAIDKEIKARESEADALEFEIKLTMKDRTEIVIGETTAATWKERNYTWLDQAAIRDEHPQLHRKYTVKHRKRTFVLKQFGWKGAGNDGSE